MIASTDISGHNVFSIHACKYGLWVSAHIPLIRLTDLTYKET